MYVIVIFQKDKGEALKDHILKDIVPRGFDARIKEIQGKHNQQARQLQQTIQEQGNRIQAIWYDNVGLQDEKRAKDHQIVTLQRRYVGYLSDEDKNNGISIIAKNNEKAGYPYIPICGQHGYRRHKAWVLLARNQGSTLFADGDTRNTIVMYNFWRENRLIVVDRNNPRHFTLDMIKQEQLMTLNDT